MNAKFEFLAGLFKGTLLLVLLAMLSPMVFANTAEAESAKERVEKVLEQEEFNKKKTVKSWRLKDMDDEDEDSDTPEWLKKLIEYLLKSESSENAGSSFLTIASIIEFILWIIFISIIVYFLYRYREQLVKAAKNLAGIKKKESLPDTIFGLDVKQESMPDDIVASAKRLWAEGQSRSAIALLLRSSLFNLINEYQCDFNQGDTENECCEKIEKLGVSSISQFMRSLILVWQQLAYAHKMPQKEKFDELCQHWEGVFK